MVPFDAFLLIGTSAAFLAGIYCNLLCVFSLFLYKPLLISSHYDVSYPWGKLETGYSPYAERTVMTKLKELENSLKDPSQINILHCIDKVLFSHGGFTTEFVKWFDEDLPDADIDDVIDAVNDASRDYLWNDESPLWPRPQNKTRKTFREDAYKQVVGHMPVEKIFEKDGIIPTDVFSTYRDGMQIGESAMVVIDSETGEYEKIEVIGKLGYRIEKVSAIDD